MLPSINNVIIIIIIIIYQLNKPFCCRPHRIVLCIANSVSAALRIPDNLKLPALFE